MWLEAEVVSLTPFLEPVLFGIGAFLSAFAAFSVASRRRLQPILSVPSVGDELSGDTLVYLVRNDEMTDANFSGERFLDRFPYAKAGLPRLRAALASRFDDIDALFARGPRRDTHAFSRDGALQVTSEALEGAIRIKIAPADGKGENFQDVHRLAATEAELETLRESTDKTPFLVWREAPDGTPVWVNRAYADRVSAAFGKERLLSWPLPRLFPDLRRGEARRLSLTSATGEDLAWYECHGSPIGPDTLYTAFDATSTVQAETRLRDFMQTLTKTFAELDIGLAIFDKSRHLALFNPALTDLTQLPIEFLTSNPSLVALIDKLRERQMAPEPRDFKTWRQSIAELEAAAANGTYCETWALPGNRTYRVSGRPHPDGAIAFLIEDISAEMSLTRRFRAELETNQTVIDNLEDAIAVFSPTGALTLTNRAYRALWGSDPDVQIVASGVVETTHLWHTQTTPTPIWGDVRDFVDDAPDRVEWSAPAQHIDGRLLLCRFIPLSDGGTQVVFSVTGDSAEKRDEMLAVV